MTEIYLRHRLTTSLRMMDSATDRSAKYAHKSLANAYAARLEAYVVARALQPFDGVAYD